MAGNSLQVVLDRAKLAPKTDTAPKPPSNAGNGRAKAGGRKGTKLIGGHFAPGVSTQLRIIAAEESTTVQALLAEALDDLFVKKGKARIGA